MSTPVSGDPIGKRAMPYLTALIVGVSGGALFTWWGVPLGWVLGAMTANTLFALGGGRPAMFMPLRHAMIALLGILLGGGFTPDLVERAAGWLNSLWVLIGYMAIVIVLGCLYFIRIGRKDPVTAYFSAVPGGLSEMMMTGEAMGGNGRSIGLIHSVRLAVVVFAMPFYFRWIDGTAATASDTSDATGTTIAMLATAPSPGVAEIAIIILLGVVGIPLARKLKIPAPALMGPLILSAAGHLSGIIDAHPPPDSISVAQIVIGTSIGCRFVGVSWREAGGLILLAAGAGIAMVALSIGLGHWLAPFSGVEPEALILALAPGGLAEMSLVALTLDVDIAFVSTFHILRIALVMIIAPALFAIIRKKRSSS